MANAITAPFQITGDYVGKEEEQAMIKLNEKCIQNDNHSCSMLKTVIFLDRLFKKSSIDLSENFRVSRNR